MVDSAFGRWWFAFAAPLALAGCQDVADRYGPRTVSMPPPISAGLPAQPYRSGLQRPVGSVSVAPADARTALRGPEIYPSEAGGARAPSTISVPGAPGDPVRLSFAGASVAEVVDVILGQTLGLNYAIDPELAGSVTLRSTRPVPRASLLAVLENVLALNGATLVAGPDLYSVVPASSPLGAPASVIDRAREGYQPGRGIYVVPLENASAENVLELVRSVVGDERRVVAEPTRNLLLVIGTDRDAQAVEEIVGALDIDSMAGRSFGLLPARVANVEQVTLELQEVFAGDSSIRFVPVQRMNAVLAISSSERSLSRARNWMGRLDRANIAGGFDTQVNVYFVRNGSAPELAALLADVFDGEVRRSGGAPQTPGGVAPTLQRSVLRSVPARAGPLTNIVETASAVEPAEPLDAALDGTLGDDFGGGYGAGPAAGDEGEPRPRFIADERNNSIVIVATPEQWRLAQATLQRLDLQPLQVLIEATIAEVTLNDSLRYGLQWFFQSGNFSVGLSTGESLLPGASVPGLNLLYSTGDARVVLSALSEVTDVKVVSSPQLMVLDNSPARLQVGDQVPVTTQQAVSVTDPDAPIVNSVQLVDTGVILEVTPRVKSSGLVTLDVTQEISDAIRSDAGDTLPTIQQRRIQTSVAVSDGETVALAGLIRERAEDGEEGVPVLKDVPLLGNLFKTTSRVGARTEILVLITPRVLRSTSEARQVADELRNRLEGLSEITAN